MDKFLPILKSRQWARQASVQGVVTKPLIDSCSEHDAPFIAYGLDQGDSLAYLQQDTFPVGKQRHIVDLSLLHLEHVLSTVEWSEIHVEKHGHEITFLAVTENFYAAECLLLKKRMQEAHKLLYSNTLLVCTPRRGLLLAFPFDLREALTLNTFFDVCDENYAEGDNEQISPVIWHVEDGEIRSLYVRNNMALSPEVSSNESLSVQASSSALLEHKKEIKLYLPSQILFMSLLGTLLAGIAALSLNYKALGKREAYYKTLVAGCFFVPLCVWGFVQLPSSPYDRVFPFFTAGLVWVVSKPLQGDSIKNAIKDGARKQTISKQLFLIGVSLLFLLPVVAVFVNYAD